MKRNQILAAFIVTLFASIGFCDSPTLILNLPTKNKVKKANSGFYTTTENCAMYENPSKSSRVISQIKKGRKIWVDHFGDNWKTGYDQSGQALYVQKKCLAKASG